MATATVLLLGIGVLCEAPQPLFAGGASKADRPFSVADVLSAPHPSELSAAPVGGHVAWVFNDRGTRNVWMASPPGYQGRRVTAFGLRGNGEPGEPDDGQTIGSLAWSPNGQRLAFVRGGAPNSSGELPNPLSKPSTIERTVWTIELSGWDAEQSGGEEVEIAAGRAPLWLSDTALLLLQHGKVVRIDLGDAQENREKATEESTEEGAEKVAVQGAEKAAEETTGHLPTTPVLAQRGGLGELRLSPDRSLLAFVSYRGTHSLVGLFDFAAEKVRYLDPSVDQDNAPVFSPDGRSLAFLRRAPNLTPTIFEPQREGSPWSIRVVDLANGESREVFRAHEGQGSVYRGVVAHDQLTWTEDGFLIFPWERDGWTHLYSLPVQRPRPVDGATSAKLLTPGDFEVEYVANSVDGKGVVFSSNQDDIDRRHLWSVAASGGPVVPITFGVSIENVPTPLSNGAVAFVAATGTQPLEPKVRLATLGKGRKGGNSRGRNPTGRIPIGRIQSLAPEELLENFPLSYMVEPEQVIFAATDGLKIHGQLFLPPESFVGPRPAVLFFHGGSRRHMMLGWHYSGYYHNSYAFHQYMANQGYVVLSVNYRSGIGYGLDFREAVNYGATGGAELRDVLGAGLYLRDREDVDPDRIGLWGGSYGGYLTAMGLSHASDMFAAGVDIHGVHDWNRTIQNFIPSYEPLEDPERARRAFESSPMAQVDNWRSPVLLVHGDDDRNVPFAETIVLVEALRRLGVEHELVVFPDEVHSFLTHAHWVKVFERASRFFAEHLAAAAESNTTSSRRVAAGG